jgi:hypothetical protein
MAKETNHKYKYINTKSVAAREYKGLVQRINGQEYLRLKNIYTELENIGLLYPKRDSPAM